MAFISLNAKPSFRVLLRHNPIGAPQLGQWVLGNYLFAELEFITGLLRPVLIHFLCGLQPSFHVGCELLV